MDRFHFSFSSFKGLFSGVVIAYAITFIVFISYALLLTYTDVSDTKLEMVIVITTLLSVVVAGFDAAKMANNRGLIWGVVAGGLYAVILIIIGGIITGSFTIEGKSLSTLLISMSGGGIGGIVGINFKK